MVNDTDAIVRQQVQAEDANKKKDEARKKKFEKKEESKLDKFNARKSAKYSRVINKINEKKADAKAEKEIRNNYGEDKAAQLIRDARYTTKKKEVEQNITQSRFVKQNVDALLANPERKLGRFAMEKGLYWNPPPLLQREESTGLPVARLKDKRPPMFDNPKMFERKTNSLI